MEERFAYLLEIDVAGSIAIDMFHRKTVVGAVGVRSTVSVLLCDASHQGTHLKMLPHSLFDAVFIVTCRKTASVELSRILHG